MLVKQAGSGRREQLTRSRDVRHLVTAAGATRFSDAGRIATFAALAVTLTRDPLLVGLLAAMSFIPWLLFGLVSGVIVDRNNPAKLFIVADLGRFALTLCLMSLVFLDQLSIGLLLAAAFALTSLQTVSDSCVNSLVPALTNPDELAPVNARLSVVQSGFGQLAGPPIATSLISATPWAPFAIIASGYAVAAQQGGALSTSKPPDQQRDPDERGLAQLLVGLRWIRHDSTVRILLTTVFVTNVSGGVLQGALPLFAVGVLGVPIHSYGWVAAATAAGLLLGTFMAGRLARRYDETRLALCGAALLALAQAGLALSPQMAFAFPALVVLGVGAGLWNVPSMSTVMRAVPPELRGRVLSAYKTVFIAAVPLGAMFAGVVSSVLNLRAPIFIAAAITTSAVVGMGIALRQHSLHSERPDT